MQAESYINSTLACAKHAWETQKENICTVAKTMADAIVEKRNVFVFGCSHAGILAEEVFYRTGGLAVINPILFPGFMLNTRPVTMTSKLERLPGLGKILLEQNHVKEGDVLLIHSVSGRNTVPVEMAIEARKMGVHTACITSVAYSDSVESRHESGKHLYEVCDVVIDNCGESGDASVTLEGLPEKIGPTSTVVGAALINAMVIEIVEQLLKKGIVPPVFLSANLNGGDAHNARIFEEYGDNIFYL